MSPIDPKIGPGSIRPGVADLEATLPVVTVTILNYEAVDVLRLALRHVTAQEYDGLEILVVDNGSTDGSLQMVSEEFPTAHVVSLPRNVGCAARNAALEKAQGEFVVTLDNDALLASPDALSTIVGIFDRYSSVACIDFRIVAADGELSTQDWCHPRDPTKYANEEFLTDVVLEGACAFRREVFRRLGGYWEQLFLGDEGPELALRLVDEGYDILYTPAVTVTHLGAGGPPSPRIYYLRTRNDIWIALRNHHINQAVGSVAKNLALMGFAATRAGHCRAFLRGVRDGVLGAACALHTRRALAPSTYGRLREIRALSPSLLAKAKRHWRERLL